MAVMEPKFRRLRAMKMVEGKVMRNKTNRELAEEFHCSVDTVERTLTWAKRADIFATYEDKIVQELIPLAHSAIRDALADGNAKIAVEVFKGLNLLRTGPAAAGSVARVADDDLEAHLLEQTIDVEATTHATTAPTSPVAVLSAAGDNGLSADASTVAPADGEGRDAHRLEPSA
jgi:L-cysteine desulfidase